MMNEFAIRLKKLRMDRDLTQEEAALELGISRSTLGMYETGKREPDFETLEVIADFFNVDMNYLIGHSDEPHNWEDFANEAGICPPNDYDGDPEDWYNMKINQEREYYTLANEYYRISPHSPDEEALAKKIYDFVAKNDTERKLLMVCRKAGDASPEEKEAILKNFEATIDMYLKAKGIKKE